METKFLKVTQIKTVKRSGVLLTLQMVLFIGLHNHVLILVVFCWSEKNNRMIGCVIKIQLKKLSLHHHRIYITTSLYVCNAS